MQIPVKFAEVSIKNEDLGELYKFINTNFWNSFMFKVKINYTVNIKNR